jgi:predicted DNA-binding transcriptional regulator AlpA
MENPFEIILERLDRIERALEKIDARITAENPIQKELLTREETCELFSFNKTTLWKHTKSGKFKSYGIGNRVYYKRSELLEVLQRIN